MAEANFHPGANYGIRHKQMVSGGYQAVTQAAAVQYGIDGGCTQIIVCVQYTAAIGDTVVSLRADGTPTGNNGIFLTEGTHVIDLDVNENVFVIEVTNNGVNVGITGLR